ncbi:hypothetical protein CNBG_10085 [Cryptococcus deuterogattii R265]|uniref:uncharacterized protein n=1 Tax=Cryptococcus deuterogattii (strain R265) TaxID=294750 RepID=UPI001936A4AB|nr:hypothetical protein CNBG_10085 [Cryptococcus deuterogattii R265]
MRTLMRTFNHLRRQHLWLLLPLPSPHSILAQSARIGEFSQRPDRYRQHEGCRPQGTNSFCI